MVAGCTSGSKFRIGTGFDFIVKPYVYGALGAWQMAAYNGDLGVWLGSQTRDGHPYLPSSAGGIVNVLSSSGYVTEPSTTITQCNFCEMSYTVSGNGSLSDNGTKYQEKYRKSGSTIVVTASPSTGYKVQKLLVNGSQISMSGYTSGDFTYTINGIQMDYSIVAYFVPSSYTVTCNAPSGGTVAFTKNGVAATVPFACAVDDTIVCTATPNADKMVQNFVLDGAIATAGSTGPQSFSFTIFERADDATYNCTVAFSDRTATADSVVGKSNGTTDDAVVTCDGTTVAREENGVFAAYVGNTYLATAATPTIFRSYGGWRNANGDVVSEGYQYAWTQGSNAVSITALYVDNPLYTENFYVGTSTSDYGTGSTAVVAGCTATITRPEGTTKDGKWLGGTRTVTATNTPSGWSFSGVYVSDTDKSGGTKFYKANGASSVTFDNACNATIYALFAKGGEVSPEDVDQGNSSIASGTAANGLYKWEGGTGAMQMKWHSKRYIASMPMALSTARVYADSYSTGADPVTLKAFTFQSPESTDAQATTSVAKSQDAYRMPMRRPEKYIELEVSSKAQVTQIAVATSMEALWQT